jgi:hypothetical protein
MRGLDSTWKSAGAGCEMGEGALEQVGKRRSGRDAIPPSDGVRACDSGGSYFLKGSFNLGASGGR